MKTFFLIIVSFFLVNICSAQLVVYPSPVTNFADVSSVYKVSVSQNGATQPSFVYQATAGTGTQYGDFPGVRFHWTTFSFAGTITVTVTKLNSTAATATVRPLRFKIGSLTTVTSGSGKSVSFNLTQSQKLSVEFADDPNNADALMIFADNLESAANVPSQTASNVLVANGASTGATLATMPAGKTCVYFPPGVYNIGQWIIPTTVSQVYIAGGAYVEGFLSYSISPSAKNSIKINGRGILSGEGYGYHYPSTASDTHTSHFYKLLSLTYGVNDLVEGLTFVYASGPNINVNANNITIQNVKICGFEYNNDGITVSGGSGCTISNCFVRDEDDSIVPYGQNLNVNNCTFWQTQGAQIQLGWTAHSMTNFIVNNCDIIHDKSRFTNGDCGFINAMNLSQNTVAADINNFSVSNIYYDTNAIRFIDIRGDRPGAPASYPQPWVYRIFNVSNIYLMGSTTYPIIYVHGVDPLHPAITFNFTNINFNGVKVTSTQMASSSFFHSLNLNPWTIN